MPTIRVLSPAIARSPIAMLDGKLYAVTPGVVLDVPDQHADQLCANGFLRVGTVGTTASRPSSSIASNVGAYLAQAGSLHWDTSLTALIVHDGTTWRNPATGAVV